MTGLGRMVRGILGILMLPLTLLLSLILLNGGDITRPVESLREITSGESPSTTPSASTPQGKPTKPPASLPSKKPIQLPPDTRPPGEAKAPTKEGLTSAQVIALAEEVCPEVLPAKQCGKYPVSIQKLSGEAGRAVSESRWSQRNGVYSSELVPTKIILDSWLKDQRPQYIKHVAAHEWNHIKQYLLAKTPERYDQMQTAANKYFGPRVEVSLQNTTGGIELLTDCMTVLGDGIGMGEGRGKVTAYAQRMSSATTMEGVCGKDWELLLELK